MDALTANIDHLAIFGGSGATGQALISHALRQGFKIRALARQASSLSTSADRLEVVVGSLSNPDDVIANMQGCSAVICVFGPRPPYTDIFCGQATATIVSAMQKLGVRRLVCQTGGMIGDYRANRTLPFQVMTAMFKRHSPRVADDRVRQERIIMHSELAWTIVKPPRLTNDAATGKWSSGTDVRLGILSSVTRSDLADFLLAEIVEPKHIGQTVFVRN